MNGKGSKPRPYNIRVFEENYDQINWGDSHKDMDFVVCFECGQPYKLENRDKHMKLENGDWVCKYCNFN